MPSAWPELLLGDIAADVTVGHVGPMASRYVHAGVPFLRSQNVRRLRLDLTDVKFIPPDFHRQLSKSRLRPGDVVVVRTGEPGVCAVVPEELPDANCADLVIIRPGPRINARFLAYYVNEAAAHHVASHLVGAVQQHFNVGAARILPIRLPSIAEQEAIVEVLGSLDDKIEQNRRTERALEGLARAIFKAWFVDFEPVKAKAAGAINFPGMRAEAFAALPDRLVDSRIGPVPEGWALASLPQLATFLNGLALQKYPARGDGSDLPVIKIAELRKGSSVNADAANSDVPGQFVVNDGDLLFSWSGTLEVQRWFGGKGALNQHLFKVTPTRRPLWYVHHAILQHLPDFRTIASSKATTMGHIQRKHLDAALVAVPAESVLHTADELFSPIYALSARLRIENRALATLRDYLLPRLLTGEVRVRTPVGTDGP